MQPLCSLCLCGDFLGEFLTTEQLCWKSSRKWLSFDIPGLVIANHDIDDGQEFSHTGDDGDLLKFVSGDEPLIESFDNWVAANGSQGGHVELGADLGTAGKNVTSTTLFTTVTIERCYAG